MNREIKFRAWDGEKMICHNGGKSVGNPHIDFNGYIYVIGESKHWNLMQYTGLKDKNGKEIYEGDIVKRIVTKYDFDKPDEEDTYKEEQISFIEYRGNGFWVHDEDFGYEGENMWDWSQMEVIGNIYENAGLLAATAK